MGALRAPYVAEEADAPNLDANGRKMVAGAVSPPESVRLDYCSRDNRTVTFQLDERGVHRPVRATRSFVKTPSWRAGPEGAAAGNLSSDTGEGGIEGKLQLAAGVVCVAAASALHGGIFLGQGLATVLPSHALIAGPYAVLLLLALLLQLKHPSSSVVGGRRVGGDPVSGHLQRRMVMMRLLACASHVAAMLSLRAAQLLMVLGHIAVPLAMAESIRLALDWPAQVRAFCVCVFNVCTYTCITMYCQCAAVCMG